MPAEPETRIEKGVDVKFSIQDLEEKKTTTWEGVRNHQAKNFLKTQMELGHLCLFYASNCKVPGVAGIARVCKEGYPDYNAWDPKHPYYDPRSKEQSPTWYMVDVEFVSKLPHLVPLALLQLLPSTSPDSLPPSLSYLTPPHLAAISTSTLLSRGRLSVQPATRGFFEAVRIMGEKGGWEEGEGKGWFDARVRERKGGAKGKGKEKATAGGQKGKEDVDEGGQGDGEEEDQSARGKRRRKA
ncbi:hypothetical protein JCM11641_005220 [Rhodosporidiobolus odoratus]